MGRKIGYDVQQRWRSHKKVPWMGGRISYDIQQRWCCHERHYKWWENKLWCTKKMVLLWKVLWMGGKVSYDVQQR